MVYHQYFMIKRSVHFVKTAANGLFLLLALLLLYPRFGTAQSEIYYIDVASGDVNTWDLEASTSSTLIDGFTSPIQSLSYVPEFNELYFVQQIISEVTYTEINRYSFDTGTISYVIDGSDDTRDLVADVANARLYWTNGSAGLIEFISLDGGGGEPSLIPIPEPAGAIDVNRLNGDLYFASAAGDKIFKKPFGSSTVTTLLSGAADTLSFVGAIEVDETGNKIYWADLGSETIRRANLDGSGNEQVLAGLSTLTDMTLDRFNKKIYWAEGEGQGLRRAFYNGSNVENLTNIVISASALTLNTPLNNTTSGDSVEVSIPVFIGNDVDTVIVIFDNVIEPGITEVTIDSGQNCPPPPPDVTVGDPPICYLISTTAVFSGDASIELSYANQTFSGLPNTERGLYHYEGVTWVEITDTVLTEKRKIKGRTSEFSPFAVFEKTLPVPETDGYLILSDGDMDLAALSFADGDVHSNGDIQLRKGDPSVYRGNFSAVGEVTIRKRNTIEGDVLALSIDNDGEITGVQTSGTPADAVPLPVLAGFAHGAQDVEVAKHATVDLLPGAYGDVEINRDGTLQLHSGEYFLKSLEGLRRSKLEILLNAEQDPVIINITTDLEFGREMEMTSPAGEAVSSKVIFNCLQNREVKIGRYARLLGSIIAPEAKVSSFKEIEFRGQIWAKAVEIGRGSVLLHHTSTGTLPKRTGSSEPVADAAIPVDYRLAQNYPNPFNPATRIAFALPQTGALLLKIYNVQGELVRVLVDGTMTAGQHEVTWDGNDTQGRQVSSGVYFYLLRAETPGSAPFQQVRKMLLVR